MTPKPDKLRLITTARGGSAKPPLGLREWSPDAESLAVLLDGATITSEGAPGVSDQIPKASTVPAGTPVVVLGTAVAQRASWPWRGLFGPRTVQVSRAVRCAALIARGYVDVGAGIDESTGGDLAWGWVPS